MVHAQSARYYDAIYQAVKKDYAREVGLLHDLIQRQSQAAGNRLLDVACGTGGHIEYLQQYYQVTGLDIDADMLACARAKCPQVSFYQHDMVDFDLERQFDVVVCLFSAIGYVKTYERLAQALATFKRHLRPGGLIVVEPWLRASDYIPGRVHAVFVDQPDLKLARMNVSKIEEGVSVLDFNYLIATPKGVEHFNERHELGLFTDEEYQQAIQAAGLELIYDPDGITGRGLYIGTNP